MAATWRDNDRRLHKINIEEVFYCPNSLVNLIGITKLGKQIENDKSQFPTGTSIQTYPNHYLFC